MAGDKGEEPDGTAQSPKPLRRRRASSGNGRITLREVSQETGLSTATISRALNEPGRVTKETREKVIEAISRLGYVPHGVARALASRTTRTIGAIIPTIENSFFAKVITAFQKRLTENGYSLLLATTEYDFAAEVERVNTFIGKSVDGLMLIGEKRDPAIYEILRARRIPFLNVFVYNASSPYPSCGFDHAETVGPSVEHLADLGHAELGMIIGDPERNDRAASRLAVARQTAQRRGMRFREENIRISEYSLAEARRMAREILLNDERPTAIVCGNDLLAMGALFAAQDLGLKVPEDLSIFGHGDFDFASELTPPLSTVRLPEYEIGEAAADFLMARIAGESVQDHIRLDSFLEIRGTTAPPPAIRRRPGASA